MLLDLTHKVPGVFVGGCNLCNPVIKEGPFCRSCSRAEQTPILSGSYASLHSLFHHSLDRVVTVIFLVLVSHVLEITLETAIESKFRSSTESSLEKLSDVL